MTALREVVDRLIDCGMSSEDAWDCVRPGSRWVHRSTVGVLDLSRHNGRGQTAGWYLGTPEGSGDWMGATLTEAALAAEPVILAELRDMESRSER